MQWFIPAMMLRLFTLVAFAFLAFSTMIYGADEDVSQVPPERLQVLSPSQHPETMLHQYWMHEVEKAVAERREKYELIKTPEQVAAYQKEMRNFLVKQLGSLPERTPLNPRIVGTIERDGYTVEKVIFESQPGFFVTALLYLPDGVNSTNRAPGVIVPCGHHVDAKGCEAYQQVSALLALNGMVAFCYDAIEQGERKQRLNSGGKPIDWGTTSHCKIGVGSTLLGRNTVTFRCWDGVRAIDYLQSRPEVDAERIGCTGNSGGGTMTSFMMALDNRIDCAAPSCYITSLDRLLNTIGPQDAEQHFFGQIGFGFDHAEFVTVRAPRPTLICCATQDFFDIDGVWESFRDAKRIYTRLDRPQCVDLAETDMTHGFTPQLRAAAVQWMRRWLCGIDAPITEPEIKLLTKAEFTCTPKRQVMLLGGARSTYDLNREFFAANRSTDPAEAIEDSALLRRIAEDASRLQEIPAIRAQAKLDHTPLEGCEYVQLPVGNGLILPGLLIKPQATSSESTESRYCLYLHDKGKQGAITGDGSPVMKLVDEGYTVLAIDVRGIGETKAPARHNYAKFLGTDWSESYIAYMLGSSTLEARATDILRSTEFLRECDPDASIEIVATGRLGPAALLAVAAKPEGIEKLTLVRTLCSWESLLNSPDAIDQLASIHHGVLLQFDLPDLVEKIKADGVAVELITPVDAMDVPMK